MNRFIVFLSLMLSLIFLSSSQTFARSKFNKVTLYFPSEAAQEREKNCGGSDPVPRKIVFGKNIADRTLRSLLAGPSEEEQKRGMDNPFKFSKAALLTGAAESEALIQYYRGLSIRKGVATLSFTGEAMVYLNSTVCVQSSVKGPIERTLRQFPTIREIRFRIDGEIVDEWDG